MATPLILVAERGQDGTHRITAVGEIDLSNVGDFAKALTAAIAEANRSGDGVTVDLGAVKYLDSAAINTLFAHADRVERMRLIVHPFLLPVLTISGLSDVVPVEAALSPEA